MSRLARWIGILGLAGARTRSQLATRQARSCILGVGIAIGLMVIVSAVALGLAASTTVESGNADYRVTAGDGATSASVDVSDPQLGSVREATAAIRDHDSVTGATPVLVELLRVSPTDRNEEELVVVVGVVSGQGIGSVSGTDIRPLTDGDPHYGGAPATNEAVVSPGAAELLATEEGDQLVVAGDRTVDVIAVAGADQGGPSANVPVVAMQLSELQALTGAADGDRADEIHVSADGDVSGFLEGIYPDVSVRSDSVTDTVQESSEQALAVALVAAVLGIGVGVAFTATSMGLLIANDRRRLAVLGAIGLSRSSRAVTVLVTTLAVTLLGGVLGLTLAGGGIAVLNRIVGPRAGVGPLAATDPVLGAYGLVIALGIGLLSAPYLILVANRTSLSEAIER